VIVNRQNQVHINLAAARGFVRRLRGTLNLGHGEFNVCFVDDPEIERLNAAYRGRRRPTDVLSFAWKGARRRHGSRPQDAEFAHFLGDVVISAETARRNARLEGRSTRDEIRWLILHGLLHLLGYDHETDNGQMTSLELSLREQLGVAGRPARLPGRRGRRAGGGVG
jgi:probable rRNA maturation factor